MALVLGGARCAEAAKAVEMAKKKSEPSVWDVAPAGDIGAVLKGARIAITAQDPDLRYTGALNGPFLFDGKPFVGGSDPSLFSSDTGRKLIACKQRVTSSGRGESIDIPILLGDQAQWHRLWVEPVGLDGDNVGVLCAAVDVTEQKVAEEHLRLALLELAHRSKNLLAVVLSIARQSVDESQTLTQFSSRFVGRIRSLALAHDVLTDESWRGATVFSLVRSQISAFSENAASQSEIEGHNAYLKPNAVQYVGLALHELIAQSMVSGALSVPDGRIRFISALAAPTEPESTPALTLRWEESRMPEASAEQSQFGRALLEQIVPAALGGTATLEGPSDKTLLYRLTLPSSQFF